MSGPVTPADLRRALLAHLAGDHAGAEAGYRRALTHGQLAPLAHRHLVRLLEDRHRWDEALTESFALMEREPDAPEVKVHLGTSLLAMGRYAEGWPLYEARAALAPGKTRPKSAPYPEWDGRPIRSLVVWDEQGFGDAIQFCRFVPQLVASGVTVTLMVRPELTALLAGLGAEVRAAGGPVEVPIADGWTMISSLGLRMGATVESLAGGPYLAAPVDHKARWAERLRNARIGVVARGRAAHANDAHRSLSNEGRAFLLSLPGAVNLSPEDGGLPFADFADTAGAIEALDLVIAVDTAAAHLAGAMGKPCWLLLPYLGGDWRWLHERTDSPWYGSMKLYRQPAAGDWASVLRAVAEDIPGFFIKS